MIKEMGEVSISFFMNIQKFNVTYNKIMSNKNIYDYLTIVYSKKIIYNILVYIEVNFYGKEEKNINWR